MSLALLQFDEGKIISKSGEYFFKVYGANLHDENKISRASYKDRIKWVDDNESKILNMDMEFILKADSRFDFIAFCLAYKRFKAGKKVHLPIFLDATCSGIQHFSTILKDVELAKSVNVIPDDTDTTDRVHDIYTEMIKPTNKRIAAFVDENPSYFKLLNVNITRKLIKPTIMTVPYNVTVKGVTRQLISSFEVIPRNKLDQDILTSNTELFEQKDLNRSLINGDPVIENFGDEIAEDVIDYYGLDQDITNDNSEKEKTPTKLIDKVMFKVPSVNENENLYLTYKEVFHLAKIMHETLFNYYPALKQLFEYFVSICLAFTKLDIPILWYPPSGLKIQQRYLKTAKAKVSISVGRGKIKTVVLNKKLDKTNTRAQTQAIIPNIIHSMDSAHLILILNKIVNQNNLNNPVISIHDCFGTLPNNMISLENLVKLEFINLYSKKEFLENFNNDLINILDKNKIYYEINKLEHKVYIYLDRSNDYKNTTISLNKNKKLEPIVFWLPPKVGNLNLDRIKDSNYLIT